MNNDTVLKIFEFIGSKNRKYNIKKLDPSIHKKLSNGNLPDFIERFKIPTTLLYLNEMWYHDNEFVLNELYKKIQNNPFIFGKYGSKYLIDYLEINKEGDNLIDLKNEIIRYIANNDQIIDEVNDRVNPSFEQGNRENNFDHYQFIALVLSCSNDIPGDLKKYGKHGIEFVEFINDNFTYENYYSSYYINVLCQNINNIPLILKHFDSNIILLSILRSTEYGGVTFLKKILTIYPKISFLIINSDDILNMIESRLSKGVASSETNMYRYMLVDIFFNVLDVEKIVNSMGEVSLKLISNEIISKPHFFINKMKNLGILDEFFKFFIIEKRLHVNHPNGGFFLSKLTDFGYKVPRT